MSSVDFYIYLKRCGFGFDYLSVKYTLFLFPRFGNEAKGYVQFCHSTRNTSRDRWKVKNGSIVMETECFNTGMQREAKK